MGRCGTLHAWQQEGIEPDLQTTGKGLGGGYAPVSAVLVHRRVVEALNKGTGAFMHGQTYQGHPIGCAVALTVQKEIRERDLLANVREKGALLEKLLKERLAQHPHVGDIRGKGLFWGVSTLLWTQTSKGQFNPNSSAD
jgi:adenosylmethionine-8-amino-7-oxononanoate aminotransferase